MRKTYLHVNRSLPYIFLLSFWWTSSVAVAQTHPIVGTWDITISGLVKGGGYLTFDDQDNSITGYIMLRPNPDKNSTSATDTTVQPDVGFFIIDGVWSIGESNRIIGFFSGTPDLNCGPEDQVLIVNSFWGTVKAGKKSKLNIKAKTDSLILTIVGTPAGFAADYVSGSWTAKVRKAGSVFREFFSVAPSSLDLPNLYELAGDGVDYSISGCLLVFGSGKKIAAEVQEETDAQSGQAVVRNIGGTFNTKKGTAVLLGWDDDMNSVRMDIAPE